MEHAQLIEESFAAYLSGLTTWPNSMTSISAGESNVEKDGQNIVCWVDGEMDDEDPPTSGNRWCDIVVRLKTPVVNDGGVTLTNHQNAASALQAAILDTDLPMLVSTDSFTCFGLTDRKPFREQDENAWVSGWKIHLYSCPSAIPA